METLNIGSVSITEIKELAGWRFPANALFPTLDLVELDSAAATWGVDLADNASGELMLDINCYLIRAPGTIILVDTGNGNDKFRPVMSAHHMFETEFLEVFASAGVQPDDVDTVVSTHLHQDHCGWNTQLVEGEWVPTFPKATYWFSKSELDHVANFGRTAPTDSLEYDFYRTFDDSILPVLLAGSARALSDPHVLFDDGQTRIWLEEVSGHTPGHLVVHIQGTADYAILSGDVIHHPIQLSALDMPQAGDFDRPKAAEVRRSLVKKCVAEDILLLTAHFPGPGRIRHLDDDLYDFEWLSPQRRSAPHGRVTHLL